MTSSPLAHNVSVFVSSACVAREGGRGRGSAASGLAPRTGTPVQQGLLGWNAGRRAADPGREAAWEDRGAWLVGGGRPQARALVGAGGKRRSVASAPTTRISRDRLAMGVLRVLAERYVFC